jgi:hypothetical protein
MFSRTYTISVCLLWLTAMSWLMLEKVVPSLRIGEPPSYQTILEAQNRDRLVGWKLAYNERNLGWALSETKPQDNGIIEIRSRVHFENLPLSNVMHNWLRSISPSVDRSIEKLQMDSKNSLIFDPLGKLVRFDSTIRTDSIGEAVHIRGIIEGSKLKVNVDSNFFSKETTIDMPQNAILDDALSPQTHLPNLCEGQTWTAPSFSPFNSSGKMEILIATVESREPFTWNDEDIQTWCVVYRSDPGMGVSNSEKDRAKLWVGMDGKVLKQRILILDSYMTFTRMATEEARILAWGNPED